MAEAAELFFHNLILTVAELYRQSAIIKTLLPAFLSVFTFHKPFYWVIGFFFTRKFRPAKNNHKYAILIPARNEESVIGNLLDSISMQDYPKELITVFVAADNCTDNTAAISESKGAICYRRFSGSDRTKGFALKFLFENIERDYGIQSFDGYFIFDADNLLAKDYVTRMNEAFDSGEKIITSYRNTKNFDENWISSSYAIHWLRSIRQNHRARSVLRLATNIQGTGFLFASSLVKDGWKYTSLTEDRAFTADAVAHGYGISYNDAAVFYDEQPTDLKIALRQRIRWSKGHLLAFAENGLPLFKAILFSRNRSDDSSKSKTTSKERMLLGVRRRFAAFDTLAQLLPRNVIKMFIFLTVNVFMYSCYIYAYKIRIPFSAQLIISAIFFKTASYIPQMLVPVYMFIAERNRIKRIPFSKKILCCLTWPAFDIIGRLSEYTALFKKVTWKPIPHTSKITAQDIRKI